MFFISDTIQPQFELGDYDSENQMVRKMSEMEHLNGGTQTAKALEYLVDKVCLTISKRTQV